MTTTVLTASSGVLTPTVNANTNTLVLTSALNVAAGSSRMVAVRTPGLTYGALDATTRIFSVQSDSGIGGWNELHAFTRDALLTPIIIGQQVGIATTLSLRSALGASSSDVAVTVGSSLADASVHASAKLLRVVTGAGAAEVEYGYLQKGFLSLGGASSNSGKNVFAAAKGTGIWEFSKGASDITPTLSVRNTAGKAFGLFVGTVGSGFSLDSTGSFFIMSEVRANIDAGTVGTGTILMTVAPTLTTFATPISLGGVTARSWPISATVTTAETQAASTAYADLATVGPTVTMTTGTSVLVMLNATCARSAAGNSAYMSVAVSGATTTAASDTNAAVVQSAGGGSNVLCRMLLLSVTAGSNTFTAKYKNDGGTTWTFSNRSMTVIPLN